MVFTNVNKHKTGLNSLLKLPSIRVSSCGRPHWIPVAPATAEAAGVGGAAEDPQDPRQGQDDEDGRVRSGEVVSEAGLGRI